MSQVRGSRVTDKYNVSVQTSPNLLKHPSMAPRSRLTRSLSVPSQTGEQTSSDKTENNYVGYASAMWGMRHFNAKSRPLLPCACNLRLCLCVGVGVCLCATCQMLHPSTRCRLSSTACGPKWKSTGSLSAPSVTPLLMRLSRRRPARSLPPSRVPCLHVSKSAGVEVSRVKSPDVGIGMSRVETMRRLRLV